jgi:hypothetical protein
MVRGCIVILFLGIGYALGGLFGPGYLEWWSLSFAEHSLLPWMLTTPPITLILWVAWYATFTVAKQPGSAGWWKPGEEPSLHKVDMRLPARWALMFYGWLLLSPTLPFHRCFIRHLVLRQSIEHVLR